MQFGQYPGWEFVSGDHRREPYWRRTAPNWQNPSPAQEECRRKFGELATQTKGLTGTTPLPDGRILSTSAIEISKALIPQNCIEHLQTDIVEPIENEVAAPQESAPIMHGRDEPHSGDISVQDIPVQDIPDVQGTVTTRQVDEIAAVPAPQVRPQDEMLDILMKHAIAEREKHEADRLALLEKERELYTDRMKQDFERSKAAVDERMKRTESLIKKLNTPSHKTEDAALGRLKKQIEEIQHKLEEKPVPKPIIKAPEIPPPVPAADDIKSQPSASEYSWSGPKVLTLASLGSALLVGGLLYGSQSPENLNNISIAIHTFNRILKATAPIQ